MSSDKITLDSEVPVPPREALHAFQRDYRKEITIPAVWFPVSKLKDLMPTLSRSKILTHVLPNKELPQSVGYKLFTLQPNYQDFPFAPIRDIISREGVVVSLTYTQTYQHLHYKEVMEHFLPPEIERPSSWETIGHILHLNLTEEQMPYRYLIGEILLSKTGDAKTVLTKTGSIESVYRTFPFEIIAGEDNTQTVVVQHGNRFHLDYAKVYWNSRLEREHERLVEMFTPTDTIVDMFAGIGPFAIPAAKKGCQVLANDLNPDSYQWLQENVKRNKVSPKVRCYNLDGRDFISGLVSSGQKFHHVIMNLPASAVEFLDVISICKDISGADFHPTFHVYGFVNHHERDVDILSEKMVALANQYLPEDHQLSLAEETTQVHLVRIVSTGKYMMCLSFIS